MKKLTGHLSLSRLSQILALAVVCAAATSLPAAAASPPFALTDTMRNGLHTLHHGISGSFDEDVTTSAYVLWGNGAFPVVLGKDTPALPVVAAVEISNTSKLVAFGHEGIPGRCCLLHNNFNRLTINAFIWLTSSRPRIHIALLDGVNGYDALPQIAQALETASPGLAVTTSVITLAELGQGLALHVDILWIDTYHEYHPADVAALLQFARQPNKGLLVAGHAWYWGYFNQNANIYTDLTINRVLWPLGLAVTTTAQTGWRDVSDVVPDDWAYLNSYYTLSALKKPDWVVTPAYFPAANAALNFLLRTLPPRSRSTASGLDGVWASLGAARASSGPAVGPNSPLDWLNSKPGEVLDIALDAFSVATGDLAALRPSRSAGLYPGLLAPSGTTSTTATVVVNGNNVIPDTHFPNLDQPVWRSTGLYAPPGKIVTVKINKPSAVNKGLEVQIGAHTDDLTFKETWARVPRAVATFAINATTIRAGSVLGGLIFIRVPRGCTLGSLQVTITGAAKSPLYKLGETTKAQWATIRNYPGPWAELDSGRLIIMLPSKAIRKLADPAPVLKLWNRVMAAQDDLAQYRIPGVRAERFLVDADISAGWMHAGYPIMAYDVPEVHQELLDVNNLKAKGAWGPFHELGHNHQWQPMMFKGAVESQTNLFTVYALEQLGVPASAWENSAASPAGRAEIRAEYLANGANWERDWDVWVALDTYLQLKEGFGWSFYKRLHVAYQRLSYPLQDDNVQTWIQMTSIVANRNLVPFYRAWGFPISQNTIDRTARLRPWAEDPMK